MVASLLVGMLWISNSAFSKPLNKRIAAVAHSIQQPVLIGVSTNPILQVRLSIPANEVTQTLTNLRATLNPDAIQDIQQLDIYITGAVPFSAGEKLVSFQPTSTSFSIPVEKKLAPGMHFLWISVVLRPTADLQHLVDLRCNQLTLGYAKFIPVEQEKVSYKKRIGVAIRKAGDDNVHTYRIPGIVTTNKGTLVAVYDIRYNKSGDLPGNIDVGMSRSIDGGKSWEPMKIILDMGAPHENNGVGDPAILFDPATKKIWVAALWSKGNRSIAGSLPGISPDTTGQLVLVNSSDDGQTWSSPVSITSQVKRPAWHLFFNGPGNGIAMQNGNLVFAAQYWDESKMPHATIIYSEDHGVNWKGQLLGPKSNTTESQVVETLAGTLLLNMRDNRGGYRSVATTSNLGNSWVEHSSSYNALPDPVCMGSLIKSMVPINGVRKEILFFSNPNTPSGRFNMTIQASSDYGVTWPLQNRLLIDERIGFGYSSLTQIDEHTIGLLYEGVRDLYFVKVPIKDIIKSK